MSVTVMGILTLSESEYLETSAGEGQLEWTVPAARQGAPVAFVAKGYGRAGGQRVMAFGRVGKPSRRRKRNGIRAYWYCDDVAWLRHPFRQSDLLSRDRRLVGKLGGFASHHLQGAGAAVRSRQCWNAFVVAVQRRNPHINLATFLA